MTIKHRRGLLGAVAAAVAVVAAIAVTLVIVGDGTGGGDDQQRVADLSTVAIAQRDLTEYLEISGTLDYEGTVTLAAHSSGVLMHLADEGTVLSLGEQIYLVLYAPSDADTARVLGAVASARDALSVAEDHLSDATALPDEADVAAARAAVAKAIEARDRLSEPPSPAELSNAEAAVAAASEALGALDNPTDADLAAARADIAAAEAELADLQAGPSEAEIDTAEAMRSAARERLRDELQRSDNEVDLELARAELLTAEEALADLLAGPTDAEIDGAEARLLTARERLDLLENPTSLHYAQARADLDTATEALADLRAGPTQAEIDGADADILTAERVLADLLAETTAAELAALEASAASADASLVSALADLAAHGETHRPLYLMYGATPAYRNMTVGLEGPDVGQLEQNLADLGFGDAEGFEVDGVFDDHTAAAVRRWQQATGQHIDGVVGTADVLFVAGPSVIGSHEQGIEPGQELEIGRTLGSLTVVESPERDVMATTQRVAANLPLSDRDLVSVGITVNVELPDDSDIAGTVTAINPSPVLDAQTGENVVEVTILLTEPASPVWIGATVTVEITETLIPDALVVPATALLALVEGGRAVEVLSPDGSTRLVGVETGLFVDGDVEVIGAELEAGMRVVVPR